MTNFTKYGTLINFLFFSVISYSQTANYWMQGVGARSTMLGTAVVAGAEDNGAIFYNPACVANIERKNISVNANIYGLSYFNIKDGAGEGWDLVNLRALLYPQIVSFSIPVKNPRLKVKGAIFTRNFASVRLADTKQLRTEIISSEEGEELIINNLEHVVKLNEQWGGVSFGYQLENGWSIGATPFISYRNEMSRLLSSRSIYPEGGDQFTPVHSNQSSRMVIDVVSVLLKLGIHYKQPKFDFGATLTTANLKVFGLANGWVEHIRTGYGQFNIPFGDLSAVEQTNKIKTTFKSPWSIAAGARWKGEKNSWSVAAEYFLPIGKYTVTESKDSKPTFSPHQAQVLLGDRVGSFLYSDQKALGVFNVGIGWQRKWKEQLNLLTGFRTDFNYHDVSGSESTLFGRKLNNLYHFTIGVEKESKNSVFTVGLDNALGYRRNMQQLVNFTDPDLTKGLVGERQKNAKMFSATTVLVVGFTKFL